tara:strand:- start:1632 stop:1901 length:270 start_codon:yes stop_codon:yes gene_type:complete
MNNQHLPYVVNGNIIEVNEFSRNNINRLIDPMDHFFMRIGLDCQDYFNENGWNLLSVKDFQTDNIMNMQLEQEDKDKLVILHNYLVEYY